MDNDVKRSADFYDFVAWLQVNRKQVISIAVIVLVAGAVIGVYCWHKNYNETQAEDALSLIKAPAKSPTSPTADVQPYFRVADEYPGTRAASRALLTAGGELFDDGKFDKAQAAFERFLREYADNVLADQALIGVAACLEARGKTAEAAARYDEFIKSHPSDPTIPQAKSALARLDLAQNKPELAMHLYEDLARTGNNDSWSSEAGIQLQELLAKYPNLKKPAPAPVPVAPAMSSPLSLTNLK